MLRVVKLTLDDESSRAATPVAHATPSMAHKLRSRLRLVISSSSGLVAGLYTGLGFMLLAHDTKDERRVEHDRSR